jgi:glucose/arabinose dehydrogenase
MDEGHCKFDAVLVARLKKLAIVVSLMVSVFATYGLQAIELQEGFTETLVVDGLLSPTAMQFAPDGRLFVAEQNGNLRVIQNNVLLPTPFLSVNVSTAGESGLLGVAFDPNFEANQNVYIYYTSTEPEIHNRLSRFIAEGNLAQANSEQILIEFDPLNGATDHNGGALHFGPDGKLYVAVGESTYPPNAQVTYNLAGKILRLNPDGSVPDDNPFYHEFSDRNRAIWALGLRNPFTFAFQSNTGRMFINDVGASEWEEINEGFPGANYGWPETEGMHDNPNYEKPLFAYPHFKEGEPITGCAITGGAFYNPETVQFPEEYVGDYFFGDYCGNWIRRYDTESGQVEEFAIEVSSSPVDIKVAPDGTIYYLARGAGSNTGAVYRIDYSVGMTPQVIRHPTNLKVAVGDPTTFQCGAVGETPLTFQWQKNGVDIPDATEAIYDNPAAMADDDGALLSCKVTNQLGSAISQEATLSVVNGEKPVGVINLPAEGTEYRAGDTINYNATATDAEDGDLPPEAFTWEIVFHHDGHTHPHMLPASGAKEGSFNIPTRGETSGNVWFRIWLTVTDSSGLSTQTYRDVIPLTSVITLETEPPGLQVYLDNRPVTTPVEIEGVVGMIRKLAALPQEVDGKKWIFSSWSDGEEADHFIITTEADTIYRAVFVEETP